MGSGHRAFPRGCIYAPRQQRAENRPHDHETDLRFDHHYRADIVHRAFVIRCHALRLEILIWPIDHRHDGNGARARQETETGNIILGIVCSILARDFIPRLQTADRLQFLGLKKYLSN